MVYKYAFAIRETHMGIRAAVIGASGFAGGELLRLCAGHPEIEVTHAAAHSRAGQRVSSMYPGLGSDLDFCTTAEAVEASVDLVFASLPHGQSMSVLGDLAQPRVIDLGGDFRLDDPGIFSTWYGEPHAYADDLGNWVYGLTECNREAIAIASRVANPGCYPAASLLVLTPLVTAGHIQGPIHIDAKSGVSGAGRAGGDGFDFATANENTRPYSVTGHKHIAEIEQELGKVAGAPVLVSFVPHLVPMTRGIIVTCVAEVAGGASQSALVETLRDAYQAEPFIEVLDSTLPETKRLAGTNRAEVTVKKDDRTGKVIAIAALDNLGKGAAGQAVQNANVMLGLDETLGLRLTGMVP